MNQYTKLAVAAVVVIAVGAMGIALLGRDSRSSVGGAPIASPTPSGSPVATSKPTARSTPVPPTAPPLSERFTSNLHGISIAYPAGWTTRPATELWSPGKEVDYQGPQNDVIWSPGQDVFISVKSQPIGLVTPTGWLADRSTLEECALTQPVTIDGVAGTIGVEGCDVAFVVDQGRGYVIRLYTGDGEPLVSSLTDRTWFNALLQTVKLAPENANAASPSASPVGRVADERHG